MRWKELIRDLVPPIIMRTIRPPPPRSGNYISASDTIAAAQSAGLSVFDYIEGLWGTKGRAADIIDRLHGFGTISERTNAVVEIGPGTGRFIELALKYCRPARYQIYEIDDGWRSWLLENYPVEAGEADGQSLKSTKALSCDFIHAHGVFVYLPFMISYRYFLEIARAAAPDAFVAFDIFSEECLDSETVHAWLKHGHNYPCFLSQAYVRRAFDDMGFRYIGNFFSPYGPGKSEYIVFQKKKDPWMAT